MNLNPATWPLAGMHQRRRGRPGGRRRRHLRGRGPRAQCRTIPGGNVNAALAGIIPGAVNGLAGTLKPSGLLAGCQVGEGASTTFQPVTRQNIGDGDSAYEITVTNNTSAAVTVSGFGVTFSAFGSRIGADQSTVNTALMEPGEKWNFTIGITSGVQVSVNTFLNTTCTVSSVDTSAGTVTPTVIPEQDGMQNTRVQAVQQAQQKLASDVASLGYGSASLNSDDSLSRERHLDEAGIRPGAAAVPDGAVCFLRCHGRRCR